MELGKKIYQLRKLSGMTQEQLADKLNISRQTLSKWENGTGMPDVESVVRISALFQTSLEELLLEEGNHVEEKENRKETQITLEDMIRINAHNRRMNLLLSSGLLFLAVSIMLTAFVKILENVMERLNYTLYRYIATGQYAAAPVNYRYLLIPAVLAGVVGALLCLCYFMKNREYVRKKKRAGEKKIKKQYVAGLVILLLAAGLLMHGFGKNKNADEEDLCGKIIAGLGDEEQFSWRDIGEKNNVLFTTDMTYDDGNGHNAAVYCDVYYSDGGELYTLGRIESMGTAYPVSHGKKCIYTASEHSIEVYQFDHKNKKWNICQYEEIFDENGNASYQYTEDGETKVISEKKYLDVMEDYGKSTVVNFGYGLSDNQY